MWSLPSFGSPCAVSLPRRGAAAPFPHSVMGFPAIIPLLAAPSPLFSPNSPFSLEAKDPAEADVLFSPDVFSLRDEEREKPPMSADENAEENCLASCARWLGEVEKR